MNKIENQKFTFIYKSKNGKIDTYVTSAPIENHRYHFIAYKYKQGVQVSGTRRFNKANLLSHIHLITNNVKNNEIIDKYHKSILEQ